MEDGNADFPVLVDYMPYQCQITTSRSSGVGMEGMLFATTYYSGGRWAFETPSSAACVGTLGER